MRGLLFVDTMSRCHLMAEDGDENDDDEPYFIGPPTDSKRSVGFSACSGLLRGVTLCFRNLFSSLSDESTLRHLGVSPITTQSNQNVRINLLRSSVNSNDEFSESNDEEPLKQPSLHADTIKYPLKSSVLDFSHEKVSRYTQKDIISPEFNEFFNNISDFRSSLTKLQNVLNGDNSSVCDKATFDWNEPYSIEIKNCEPSSSTSTNHRELNSSAVNDIQSEELLEMKQLLTKNSAKLKAYKKEVKKLRTANLQLTCQIKQLQQERICLPQLEENGFRKSISHLYSKTDGMNGM